MKKSISSMLGGVMLASSLLFSPIQAFSGEDVTKIPKYAELKKGRISLGARNDLTIEKEGSLIIERHTLNQGEDPLQYAKKISLFEGFGIFKGNKFEIIFSPFEKIGYDFNRTEEEKKIIVRDLKNYLNKPEKAGYLVIRGRIEKGETSFNYGELTDVIKSILRN